VKLQVFPISNTTRTLPTFDKLTAGGAKSPFGAFKPAAALIPKLKLIRTPFKRLGHQVLTSELLPLVELHGGFLVLFL